MAPPATPENGVALPFMRGSLTRVSELIETLRASVSSHSPRLESSVAPARAPISIEAPELPARFSLGDRLGAGGMGLVFRAYDRVLGQDVALKVLRSPAVSDRLFLKREFRSLASMLHPNMVH